MVCGTSKGPQNDIGNYLGPCSTLLSFCLSPGCASSAAQAVEASFCCEVRVSSTADELRASRPACSGGWPLFRLQFSICIHTYVSVYICIYIYVYATACVRGMYARVISRVSGQIRALKFFLALWALQVKLQRQRVAQAIQNFWAKTSEV